GQAGPSGAAASIRLDRCAARDQPLHRIAVDRAAALSRPLPGRHTHDDARVLQVVLPDRARRCRARSRPCGSAARGPRSLMLTRFLVFLMLIVVLAGAIMIALAYGPFPLRWEDVVRAVNRLRGDDVGAVTSGEIVFMR